MKNAEQAEVISIVLCVRKNPTWDTPDRAERGVHSQ